MAERRISTPLVLAAASGMIAIAIVATLSSVREEPPPDPGGARGSTDDRTPERAATSFYDAWRQRRWSIALALSEGQARADVLDKQGRDQQIPPEDRVVVERMWDALSRAPLELVLDTAEMPEDQEGVTVLHGTAEYMFVNRPYRRRVSFRVVERGDHYRVDEMVLGEVLTPLPEVFAGAEEADQP
jgi:hypothetical protein